MPFNLTMPKLSPTMEEGTIIKWHKQPGEFVEAGDVILEVATDKATVEHEAIDEGWLAKILIPEGKTAIVNQPIAILTAEKGESIEGFELPSEKKEEVAEKPKAIEKKAQEAPPQPAEPAVLQPKFIPEPPLENYTFEYPTEKFEKELLATPLAKKEAKEKGLDLSSVKGTGPRGRIVSEDLAKAGSLGLSRHGKRETPAFPPGAFEEQPLSQLRKVIGQRLQAAKSFIPHFYVSMNVDAESLMNLREQLKNLEIKLTVNDFIIKACAIGLKQHPDINTGFNSVSQSIIQFKTVDIAVAVSMDSGLITPIIRHSDYKSIEEISIEMRLLAQKAKEGKLAPEEYKGGSFTITNMGMYGVSVFQAILNPPQAAILAVAGIQDAPVIKNGKVVPGKTMQLTLSVDHRVIDGAKAAHFLKTLKNILENPACLLLN